MAMLSSKLRIYEIQYLMDGFCNADIEVKYYL